MSDPRPDCSSVDALEVEMAVTDIAYIVGEDRDESQIASDLKTYVDKYLRPKPEFWVLVHDRLARDKVISKAHMRALLSHVFDSDISEGHLRDL